MQTTDPYWNNHPQTAPLFNLLLLQKVWKACWSCSGANNGNLHWVCSERSDGQLKSNLHLVQKQFSEIDLQQFLIIGLDYFAIMPHSSHQHSLPNKMSPCLTSHKNKKNHSCLQPLIHPYITQKDAPGNPHQWGPAQHHTIFYGVIKCNFHTVPIHDFCHTYSLCCRM